MGFLTVDHVSPPLFRVISTQIYKPRVARRYPVYTSSAGANPNYPLTPMGRPEISQDLFANLPKADFGPRASVQSVDNGTPTSALGSTVHLFDRDLSPDEQQWRPGVRDWLVFTCIVILAMMDAYDAAVLIPVLPVSDGGYQR